VSGEKLLQVIGGEHAGSKGRLLSALPDRVLLQLVPGGLLAVVQVQDIQWPTRGTSTAAHLDEASGGDQR
jgi:hypothetical protein